MPEIYVGVKFKTIFLKKEVPKGKLNKKLIEIGKKIAKYELNGNMGWGNISYRFENGFVINATKENIGHLDEKKLVFVKSVDWKKKCVKGIGLKEPSSECFMHAAAYELRKDVNVVLHLHDDLVLKHAKELGIKETINEKPYGTIELAEEIKKVLGMRNCVAIKNHGILALGKNIREAFDLALKMHKKSEELKK